MMKTHITDTEALRAVDGGADIWDRLLAGTLREIEREQPGLINICSAMMAPKNGAAQQPYFGCILTAAGKARLAELEAGT